MLFRSERKRIAKRYIEGISNPLIHLPLSDSEEYSHVYHVFVIRSTKRDELEKYLNESGVGTVKHYPIPIYLQRAYNNLNIPKGALPVADEISDTVLSLPMFYGMKIAEIDKVIELVNQFK